MFGFPSVYSERLRRKRLLYQVLSAPSQAPFVLDGTPAPRAMQALP
jgi:hypothetical protein